MEWKDFNTQEGPSGSRQELGPLASQPSWAGRSGRVCSGSQGRTVGAWLPDVRLGFRTTSAGKQEVQWLSQYLVLLVCSLCVLGFHLYFSHLVSTEQLGWLFSPFFRWGDWVSEIFGWSVQSHTARRCGAGIGMIWTQAESGETERMGLRLTEGPMGGDFCSQQGLGMILFNQDCPPSLFELM